MDKEPIRVRTRDDEWDDFTGGLIVVGLILAACVGISAGMLKILGFSPEIGIPAGSILWIGLIIKYNWMREVILEAIYFVSFIGAIFATLGLLIWAFN